MRRLVLAFLLSVLALPVSGAESGSDFTPMIAYMSAIKSGNTEAVRGFLESGLDPNYVSAKDLTPILIASKNGRAGVVQLLLGNRAIADATDEGGNTSLIWASQLGYPGVVDVLIKHKAGIDIQNKQGLTALMKAISASNRKVVDLLIEAGCDLEIQDHTGRSASDWAEEGRDRRIRNVVVNAVKDGG